MKKEEEKTEEIEINEKTEENEDSVTDKKELEVNSEEKIEEISKEPIENREEEKNEVFQEQIEEKEETEIRVEEIKEEEKNEKAPEEIKKEFKKVSLKTAIVVVLLCIALLFLSTIFAILNINNNNVISGVYIEDIDISNLSKDEMLKKINDRIKAIEEIEIKHEDYNTIIKTEDIGLKIDTTEAIEKAINLGRTNNIIIDNYNILKAKIFKTKLDINITIDQEKYKDTVKNIQAEIPGAIQEYSYEIKDDELLITPGKEGKVIELKVFENDIIDNIQRQINGEKISVEVYTKIQQPKDIDIEAIYKEIYQEAKDAYIIEEPFELHKEEEGIDLDISIEEAKKILSEVKEVYSIPLKITKPKVYVKDLGDKLFKQTLASYTTIYDAGVYNRAHNIALAAKTINGTILLPGETFSYNGVLGNTNQEKGYKVGTAYVGGKVVESYGGGICQVSSTLYNAVLYANLEIVERHNHSYVVNYVPAGRDATVAYGGKNFRFKNTRSYPIKIVASAKNGVVSISIKGIKEEKEYDVVLTSSVLSSTPNQTVYEPNSNLAEGTEKVIQKGYVGKKSITYKTVKYNGKVVSKTVLSKDTYKPMNKIIQVGTKKVLTEQPSTPEVTTPIEPTTNPTPETITNTIV